VKLVRRNYTNRGRHMLDERDIKRTDQKSVNCKRLHAIWSVFGRFILVSAIGLIFSFDAGAQFIVQPMQLVVQGRRSSVVTKAFKLENRDTTQAHFVTIELVDLFQAKNGGHWQVFEPNMLMEKDSGYNSETHPSCKDWISVRRNEVEVPSSDSTSESLSVRIPGNARGFSCAGLKVTLKPRPGLVGVVFKYDFVVPILVSVDGHALTSNVKVVSAGLKYEGGGSGQQERVSLLASMANNGTAYSKFTATASIWQVLETGRSRSVKKDLKLFEKPMVPGSEFNTATDLGSDLPTGKYKISIRLNVDGRRVKGLTQEVDFVNPTQSGLAHVDAAMRLNPARVDLDMNPGRVGNQKIVIRNYSDEDIVVKAVPVVPDAFANRVTTVRGNDISCADWIEIRPNELPIRAGGQRTVTVVVRMPKEDQLPVLTIDPTNYYSMVKFYGFYRDRSSAGISSALVNVKKRGAEPVPTVQQKELKIQSLGQSRFLIVGVFANYGTVDVTPTCVGRILAESSGSSGSTINYGKIRLTNEDADAVLMPFTSRAFSTEYDFSNIPAGRYTVVLRLDYAKGLWSEIQKQYEVYDSNGEKLIFASEESIRPVANSGG